MRLSSPRVRAARRPLLVPGPCPSPPSATSALA